MNVSNDSNVMFRYNSEYVAIKYINVPIIIHCVHSNTNSVPIIPVLITVIIQSTILQYNNDDYYSNSSLKIHILTRGLKYLKMPTHWPN